MLADTYALGAATGVEGPLLFLKRTVNVGLNQAVSQTDHPLRAISNFVFVRDKNDRLP